MTKGPLSNPATSELGSPGLFLTAFSRLTSVTGSSVSDVAGVLDLSLYSFVPSNCRGKGVQIANF